VQAGHLRCQQPSVGRIVHYQGYTQTEPLAAIIVAVLEDDYVHLALFQRTGISDPRPCVPFSETPEEMHWNWPSRS
jgi:hypothetical protein